MSDPQHKQLRPSNRAATGDRIKLHLRLLRLNGKTWRVLTLRPGTEAAFSTNYFHETWHFISDKSGAELLGRILWGLSYQREPNTIFLLHGEHLKPTPFEAESSLPFVLIPTNISAPDPQAFAELRKLLPRLPNPTATVRLQTWGLDELLNADDDDRDWQHYGMPHRSEAADIFIKERVIFCGGVIAYCAPAAVMRVQGYSVHETDYWYEIEHQNRVGYHELAEYTGHEHIGQGEVQIFSHYREMLSNATEARRDIARDKGGVLPAVNPDTLRQAIWEKTAALATRRRQAKQGAQKQSTERRVARSVE